MGTEAMEECESKQASGPVAVTVRMPDGFDQAR